HPLRPATRNRLGRPLPHQQADRPRAHPQPQQLSTPRHEPQGRIRHSAAFPPPIPASGAECSRATHPFAARVPRSAFPLDAHALPTPPACVLSQDQTLHKGPTPGPAPRRAAHRPSKPRRNPDRSLEVINQRNPPHTYRTWSECVTGPKQTMAENNQTRAVEFSRNNRSSRTSPRPSGPRSSSAEGVLSALLCLHFISVPYFPPNRRFQEKPIGMKTTRGAARYSSTRFLNPTWLNAVLEPLKRGDGRGGGPALSQPRAGSLPPTPS